MTFERFIVIEEFSEPIHSRNLKVQWSRYTKVLVMVALNWAKRL